MIPKLRPELKYCTRAELLLFQSLRESGAMSVFRAATCFRPKCDKEIPNNKEYCSQECQQNDEKRRKRLERREELGKELGKKLGKR